MDTLSAILEALKGFGSMAGPMKIAAVITVLLSIWKSSLIAPYWAKLGKAAVLIAPALGIVYALVTLPGGLTAANVWAGLHNGLLAIALHELLASIEGIPGLGSKWLSILEFFDGLLGASSAAAAQPVAASAAPMVAESVKAKAAPKAAPKAEAKPEEKEEPKK